MFDPYRKWLGIPEQLRPPTHYQLLGISPEEHDREVIEAAVIRQSAYVRNFQNGPNADHATRLLNEIAAARGCLLDAVKRAAYDATIRPATVSPVQVPPGTLPIGIALPVSRTPGQTAAPTPAGTPAAGSSIHPLPVRPVARADTVAPGGLDVKKIDSGSTPRSQPATGPRIQAPRSKPQPVNVADLSSPSHSLLDQLMAADIHAPAISRRSPKPAPPRTTILAAFGALGALLIIIAVVAGLGGLFGDTASTGQRAHRSALSATSKTAGASTSVSPRTSLPPSKPADPHLRIESLDLSLDQPPKKPDSQTPPVPNDGLADAIAANVGHASATDTLPARSEPGAVPGRMIAGDNLQQFADPTPGPVPSPAAGPGNKPPPPPEMNLQGQPGPFQPRLKLTEGRPFGEIRRLELTTTYCTVLVFAASGQRLAAGTFNGRVLLWSTENPQDYKTLDNFNDPRNPITSLAFTPDDKTLLVATADGHIRGISMQDEQHREVVNFTGHVGGVRRMMCFNNGACVISSGDDRTVRLWTLAEGRQLSFFGGFASSVNCLWIENDGSRIIASDSLFVGTANLDSKKPLRNFKITPPVTTPAALSHDGRYLVCPDGRGINVKDLANSRDATSFPDDKARLVGEARFSPDDQLMATSNLADPGIILWDFERRKKVGVLEAHSMQLSDIAFSPDNLLLASCSFDTSLRLWRLPDLATLRENANPKAKKAASGNPGE